MRVRQMAVLLWLPFIACIATSPTREANPEVEASPGVEPPINVALDDRFVEGFPSHVRRSQADDGLHQEKLYYLFAGLRGSSAGRLYGGLGLAPEGITIVPHKPKPVPVGFTIVKESWTATTEPRAAGPRPKPSLRTPGPVTTVDLGLRAR